MFGTSSERRAGPSRRIGAVLVAFLIVAGVPAVAGAGKDSKIPRFLSLRADTVNVRAGPGVRYPVQWVYKRRSLPVEVIAEFDTWRKIRDFEGTEGWVHQNMLSGRRTTIVTETVRTLRREAKNGAAAVARLEPGVLGRLLECEGEWCRVEVAGLKGWLKRGEIWGVYPDESIK